MTPDARDLRVHIYDQLLAGGRPPTIRDIATHFGTSEAAAGDALRALRIGKTVLLHPTTGEIWMCGPFSAVPTPYPVHGTRTRWYANCAWDMLGVAVLAGETVSVDASCTDCGAPMPLRVDPATGPSIDAVVHFLVPARRWYDDIGFT